MKTIEKICSYSLSEHEIVCLYNSEIINGCGGSTNKGGMNFEKIIESNLELIPNFDQKKKQALLDDIKLICFEHDIDFRFSKGFLLSNFRFAKKLFKLLYWAKFSHRVSIAGISFVLLSKYGGKFYGRGF